MQEGRDKLFTFIKSKARDVQDQSGRSSGRVKGDGRLKEIGRAVCLVARRLATHTPSS